MNQRWQTFISDQSGAMAVMAALLMTLLLSAAALGVDYGYMAWVQGELQKASDAGALAGARALGSDANPAWSAGQAAATSMVQQNKVDGKPLIDCQVDYGYWSMLSHTLQSSGITPQNTDTPAIRVTIRKSSGKNGGPVQLLFAPIFGVKTFDLSARAVAKLNSTQGIWSILETGTGKVTISGAVVVNGGVGVNSGGNLTMSGSTIVKGKAYLNTGATKSLGGSTSVQGGLQQDAGANTIVTAAVNSATTAYNNFTAMSATPGTPTSVSLSGIATKTITGAANATTVVKLTTLSVDHSGILTLSAPASSSFVILDSGTFSIKGTALVVLQGGLTADHVTWVNTGTSTVTVANGCIIQGNFLSPKGNISLTGDATYKGTVVGGKDITVANSVTSLQTSWLPAPGGGGQGASLVQ